MVTLMITATVKAVRNVQAIETTVAKPVIKNKEKVAVLNLGCTDENNFGNWPSLLNAKGRRDPLNIRIFKVPSMEINAPAAINFAPMLPIKPAAASANGLSEFPKKGNVPIHAICIRI